MFRRKRSAISRCWERKSLMEVTHEDVKALIVREYKGCSPEMIAKIDRSNQDEELKKRRYLILARSVASMIHHYGSLNQADRMLLVTLRAPEV